MQYLCIGKWQILREKNLNIISRHSFDNHIGSISRTLSLLKYTNSTDDIYNTMKRYCTYIKYKKTCHLGIPSIKQDGKLITDPFLKQIP